jgi:hypothetical protein
MLYTCCAATAMAPIRARDRIRQLGVGFGLFMGETNNEGVFRAAECTWDSSKLFCCIWESLWSCRKWHRRVRHRVGDCRSGRRSRKRIIGGRAVRWWERPWAGVRTDQEMTLETRRNHPGSNGIEEL